jgi:hypothetical protein
VVTSCHGGSGRSWLHVLESIDKILPSSHMTLGSNMKPHRFGYLFKRDSLGSLSQFLHHERILSS